MQQNLWKLLAYLIGHFGIAMKPFGYPVYGAHYGVASHAYVTRRYAPIINTERQQLLEAGTVSTRDLQDFVTVRALQ